MTGFFMFLHTIICIFLVTIILMQSGRGGGLTEGFGGAEAMLGAKTNEFMIKATTVFASLFLVTCLSLAVMSSKKGKSLMSDKVISDIKTVKKKTMVPTTESSVPAEKPVTNAKSVK